MTPSNTILPRFDLVIFDCDGVLVDSERIANIVFARIIYEETGLKFSLEQMFDTFVGRSCSQCMEIIGSMLGNAPPASLEHRYHVEINERLMATVTPVRGIESVLRKLCIDCCVASSGSHAKMNATLGKTGLLEYFQNRLFSASDVTRGKPAPDIYLHAAQEMQAVDPARCLVIEDSPAGVQGAVAADMVVFGYCDLMKEESLIRAGAHHTFNDMALLPDSISNFR